MNDKLPSHIFIVGVGRSGTKFLMNVINRNGLVNITPEMHFFSTVIHKGFKYYATRVGDLKVNRNLKSLVELIFNNKIFGTFWAESIPIRKELMYQRFSQSDRSLKSIYNIIIEEHCKINGKIIPGEKTPSNLYHIDTLSEWFPEAKFLHIVRNPKDIFLSEINKDVKPDYPLKKKNKLYDIGIFSYVLIQWIIALRLNNKYSRKYPDKFLTVRYEDLINNHETKVRDICLFLNIDYTVDMLNPPKVDSSFLNNTRNNKFNRWLTKRLGNILDSPAKKAELYYNLYEE